MVAPAAIFCACVSRKRHSLRLCGVMKIGLAWCGGASARGFKVRVLRWRSGWAAFAAGVVERSEISEISEHSDGLADVRL